jgi:hypothetical protein
MRKNIYLSFLLIFCIRNFLLCGERTFKEAKSDFDKIRTVNALLLEHSPLTDKFLNFEGLKNSYIKLLLPLVHAFVTCQFIHFLYPVTKNNAFPSSHKNSSRGHIYIFLFLEMLYENCVGLHFRYKTSHKLHTVRSLTLLMLLSPPRPHIRIHLISFCGLFNNAVSS